MGKLSSRANRAGFTALAVSLILAGAGAVASAKTTVSYWDKWGSSDGEHIKYMVDKFNKSQTEVFVKYVQMDGGSIQEKFLTTKMAGVGPDLVGNWNHRLAFFVGAGLVEPLDAYLKTSGLSKNDFIPEYWDMMNYDGKTYGMPVTAAGFGLYMNTQVLTESGLDPNTMPQTMDDMMIIGDKVTRKDANNKYTRIGFALQEPGYWTYLWPSAFGANLYDTKKNLVDLKQPAMFKGYDWVDKVAKKWGSNATGQLKAGGWLSKGSAFFSGKVVMAIDGSWLPSYVNAVAPKLQFTMGAIPGGEGGPGPFTWTESDIIFMAKGKHTKQASKFLMWLMKPENQREFQLRRETLSVIKAANTPEFLKANKNRSVTDLIKLANSSVAYSAPKTIAWPDIEAAYGTIFWDVFNQKKSVAQALANAEKTMNLAAQKAARRVKK